MIYSRSCENLDFSSKLSSAVSKRYSLPLHYITWLFPDFWLIRFEKQLPTMANKI
jgi:hypothetical protein